MEGLQGFPGVLIVVRHFLDSFIRDLNPHRMVIGFYGILIGQAAWKILLNLSNKSAIESNSHYIKFIQEKVNKVSTQL